MYFPSHPPYAFPLTRRINPLFTCVSWRNRSYLKTDSNKNVKRKQSTILLKHCHINYVIKGRLGSGIEPHITLGSLPSGELISPLLPLPLSTLLMPSLSLSLSLKQINLK